MSEFPLDRNALERWLREEDAARLETLFARADAVRREHVGDQVHLRGLIEVSNHCVRQCAYCGLRAEHTLPRYRLSAAEIVSAARLAEELGYGTVVLQAGEDPGLTQAFIAGVVWQIKAETGLAITLSLGERTPAELAAWRAAGADRYLLRFETSDPQLYARLHPPRAGQPPVSRPDLLRLLKKLGYEAGSGVMVGLPGQSYASLAADIDLFRELDLDMIGIGPYLAHPDTPLATAPRLAPQDQVPNTELMVYKVVALTRLVRPDANIPSTTALATLNKAQGRELGLARGANVVMPNVTPQQYRALYEIYPAKACINEDARACHACLMQRLAGMGRAPGRGPGGRGTAARSSGAGQQGKHW
jgi:biotin synthase